MLEWALFVLGMAAIVHAVFALVVTHKPEPAGPFKVAWRPVESLSVTIASYLISTFAAALVMYPLLSNKIFAEESTSTNFFYLIIFEAFSLSLLVLFLQSRKFSIRNLGLKGPTEKDPLFAVAGFVVWFALLAICEKTLPWIDFDQQQEIGFSTAVGGLELMVIFLGLVVIVPVAEEIIARGFLFGGLRSKLSYIPAALITSLLFGAAHLQAGSGNPLLWAAALDTFILSLVLVYLREKTDSLAAPILLHVLKNGVAFTFLFVIPRLGW
jgi:membrane protease YdiL (CAAX protease family)